MKAEYDLSKMKARKNPYASKLKKSSARKDFGNGLQQQSRDVVGDVLPSDFSVNHDQHLQGAPKRKSSF